MRSPDFLQRSLRRIYRRNLSQAALLTEEELARPAIIFAPHPDDETLGCGGTILRKKQAGAKLHIVFLTDGSASHAAFLPAAVLAEIRRKEALNACHCLGLQPGDITFLNQRDSSLEKCMPQIIPQVVDVLRWLLDRDQPTEIFLPYRHEPPSDHAATYAIVLASLADPTLVQLPRPILNEYPIWYWYHWPWVALRQGRRSDTLAVLRLTLHTRFGAQMARRFTHAVDIADVLAGKRAALAAHQSQTTPILPDLAWPTLADVSQGEFLDCFFQDREFFYRHA